MDLTPKNETFSAQSAFDAAGSLRIGYKGLTKEDMESLVALQGSPHWAVYRRLLTGAMSEHYRASSMVTDVDGVVKMISNAGLAAGINFAINQLQVLCADYHAKLKKGLEKPVENSKPFKRG